MVPSPPNDVQKLLERYDVQIVTKDSNISIGTLDKNEEVLVIIPKYKADFQFYSGMTIIVIIGVILFCCASIVVGAATAQQIFKLSSLIFFITGINLYSNILNYQYTNIILTNKRLIIARPKDNISIPYEEIEYIKNCNLRPSPQKALYIKKIKNKARAYLFFNYVKLKEKLIEICPNIENKLDI